MAVADDQVRRPLLRCGFALEYATLAWNVAGIVVLAIAAITARSVALAGFALDSLIEIGASTVVIWELSGTGQERQHRGLRLIGYAFAALAVYLLAQSTLVLATGHHPHHSVPGIIWTAVTAVVVFALAAGKAHVGRALSNPVLQTEGRVTLIDGILATAVLAGLVLNAALAGGGPTPPPGTCWSATPPAKSGRSSSHLPDRLLLPAFPKGLAGWRRSPCAACRWRQDHCVHAARPMACPPCRVVQRPDKLISLCAVTCTETGALPSGGAYGGRARLRCCEAAGQRGKQRTTGIRG